MTGIFGHRFLTNYGHDPRSVVADTWARTLADITPIQLGIGLQACAQGSDGWPPTLPDFRALCLGIPTFAAVKIDIGHDAPDRHPFTRLVWTHIDAFNFGQANQRDAERMLRDGYDHARELVMNGRASLNFEPLEVIAAPRSDPIKPATPEVVANVFDEIGATLGVPLHGSTGMRVGP